MGTTYYRDNSSLYCETLVERLVECSSPVPFVDPYTRPAHERDRSKLPVYPSIQAVAIAFTLNFWQHCAFEEAARKLIFSFLNDTAADSGDSPIYQAFKNITPAQRLQNSQQLVSYVGGEAGAGKSGIIQALIALARLWKRRNTLQTTGFTGISAMMIEGVTMHSLFDINPTTAEGRLATTYQRERHRCIRFLIIDEISMTS
ncbi:hypothetical protein BC829DRAFT_368856, partial [Chytridium lagenaria]